MRSAAHTLLAFAARAGIDYLFTNLGSDHPAFIEAFAEMRQRGEPMPKVVVCPHEMTALSAAHGHAMISRRPQLVLVHVDIGTQNLGGSVHNAARGRVPAIVLAGLSPVTDGGDRIGTRNEFIHYIQDMTRQHELVAPYMKWCYELRAPESVTSVMARAIQIATAPPEGPIYITGAREVWEGPAPDRAESLNDWPPARLGGLAQSEVSELYQALVASRRPVVITSYLGRQPDSVRRLVEISERIGIGVCEVSPAYLNFPGGHVHHLGYRRNSFVEEADLILMLDVDVPWINGKVQPRPGTPVFHIDIDPLKTGLGYWHFAAQRVYQADTLATLNQLAAAVEKDPPGRQSRCDWIASARPRPLPATGAGTGQITPEELTDAVRDLVTDRTVVLFEAPTCTELIPTGLRLNNPGSYFNCGGAGLGWGINGCIGAKLARPEADVIGLVGDGCYQFGVPSSTYWVANAYKTPFLTVIYNNGGWNAPKHSTLGVHPDGNARRNDTYWVTVGAGARLADIAAAAGDAAPFQVSSREDLKGTLRRALQIVREGRSAVVDVAIQGISSQVLG
ncbi:MAG TPA: thiamine pyrophosphate-requiring protein [Terriglobia bacterium]|nr:thiamine pyrophosphate-requiring protein [Terriglobia bacterium]